MLVSAMRADSRKREHFGCPARKCAAENLHAVELTIIDVAMPRPRIPRLKVNSGIFPYITRFRAAVMTAHTHPSRDLADHYPVAELYMYKHQTASALAIGCGIMSFTSLAMAIIRFFTPHLAISIVFAIPFAWFIWKMARDCDKSVNTVRIKVHRAMSTTRQRQRATASRHRPSRGVVRKAPATRSPSRHKFMRFTQAEAERLSYNQYA